MKLPPHPLDKISIPLDFEEHHWLTMFARNMASSFEQFNASTPTNTGHGAAGLLLLQCQLMRLVARNNTIKRHNIKSVSYTLEELVALMYCYMHHDDGQSGLTSYRRAIRSVMGRIDKTLQSRLSSHIFNDLFKPKTSSNEYDRG